MAKGREKRGARREMKKKICSLLFWDHQEGTRGEEKRGGMGILCRESARENERGAEEERARGHGRRRGCAVE